MCKFFVVPGNGPVLLGMPHIKTLDFLIINCNTIDMQTSSEQISRKQTDERGCTNKIQDAESKMQCITNTADILHNNPDPMVIKRLARGVV